MFRSLKVFAFDSKNQNLFSVPCQLIYDQQWKPWRYLLIYILWIEVKEYVQGLQCRVLMLNSKNMPTPEIRSRKSKQLTRYFFFSPIFWIPVKAYALGWAGLLCLHTYVAACPAARGPSAVLTPSFKTWINIFWKFNLLGYFI